MHHCSHRITQPIHAPTHISRGKSYYDISSLVIQQYLAQACSSKLHVLASKALLDIHLSYFQEVMRETSQSSID